MAALSWPHGLLHRLLEPPTRPLRRLVFYYAALGGGSLLLQRSGLLDMLKVPRADVALARAMVTSLVLMPTIPSS